MKVGLFDYGSGNLFNIKLALEREGLDVVLISDLEPSLELNALVFPGVGNFSQATKLVDRHRSRIVEFSKAGVVFGICLGMQLFLESSEEGQGKGLGLIKGKVVQLPNVVRIPHMGWNRLSFRKSDGILEGIPEASWCYFMHSYYARAEKSVVAAETEYGLTFPSVVESGTLIGTQFHPEKSSQTGKALLHNFVRILKR